MKYLFKFNNQFSLFLFVFCSVAWGRSSTIIGGESIAKDCHRASQIAAVSGFSSALDLEKCNDAIIHGKLNLRDSVATYVNRGIIKVALKDYTGGLADYETAINMDSEQAAEAYVNRGNIWIIAREYNRAVDDYKKALDLDVSKPYVAMLNLGLAFEYLGDFSQAKKYYEQALTALPEWEDAIKKLERVNKKIGTIE